MVLILLSWSTNHIVIFLNGQMASTFAGMSSAGPLAAPSTSSNKLSSVANISSSAFGSRRNVVLRKARSPKITAAAKELYFNKDGSAIKRLQVSFLSQIIK